MRIYKHYAVWEFLPAVSLSKVESEKLQIKVFTLMISWCSYTIEFEWEKRMIRTTY